MRNIFCTVVQATRRVFFCKGFTRRGHVAGQARGRSYGPHSNFNLIRILLDHLKTHNWLCLGSLQIAANICMYAIPAVSYIFYRCNGHNCCLGRQILMVECETFVWLHPRHHACVHSLLAPYTSHVVHTCTYTAPPARPALACCRSLEVFYSR